MPPSGEPTAKNLGGFKMAGKKGNMLAVVGALVMQTGLVLLTIYGLRKLPYVGPWVDTALKG